MTQREIFLDAISQRKDAIFEQAKYLLMQSFPEKHIIETTDSDFFLKSKKATWEFCPSSADDGLSLISTYWDAEDEEIYTQIKSGWFEADWNNLKFQLLYVIREGNCSEERWFILSDTEQAGVDFFSEVCRENSRLEGEILVFSNGHWRQSEELFKSIQSANLADLNLHGTLKEDLVQDFDLFLSQKETYRKYSIPWKRGAILLGPPGNGKTHAIKGMVNHFGIPCLYVKSFTSRFGTSQDCISAVFREARETSPCFLILEDLDTLLTDENRSYFLNEMDGFASNDGIITIATCNFPELLDAAITERPSRFDRKYNFQLPDTNDRGSFLSRYMGRFEAELQLSVEGLGQVASVTEGYSYAYLKELYVCSVVRWMSDDQKRPILNIMVEQAELLREQMKTALTYQPKPKKDDEEDED